MKKCILEIEGLPSVTLLATCELGESFATFIINTCLKHKERKIHVLTDYIPQALQIYILHCIELQLKEGRKKQLEPFSLYE